MVDLEPATRRLAGLVQGVRDDQLTAPTPCSETSLGDLIQHVDGLSLAFTAAAKKTALSGDTQGAAPDAAHLGSDWRTRIPDRLAALGSAWKDDAAWTGMTQAGGQDLPGELAGVIALDEVVIHGWDVAVASGQSFDCEPDLLQTIYGFAQQAATQNPHGTPGLFGPPVAVPQDAPLLDQVIGLTGRNPAWHAGASGA